MKQVLMEVLSNLKDTNLLLGCLCGLGVIFLLSNKRKSRKIDDATTKLLTCVEPPTSDIAHMCDALYSPPITSDEAECADHLREIIRGKDFLRYKSLETDPEKLLRISKNVGDGEMNGALLTRFTVQFNLFAGSIVAMGTQPQRETLYATQDNGSLGCFAFTECGAGVLSGAVVETTAAYDPKTGSFRIHSGTETSKKKWISQGMFAEYAVICANLMLEDGTKNGGPHLFYARIQHRNPKTGKMTPVKGVSISTLNQKTALLGLDNAFISFDQFEVEHSCLLNRFSSVDLETGDYSLHLPAGVTRMVDLLISRLLTGRICLSECTTNYSLALCRRSWAFASSRELWKGKKPKGLLISELPLMQAAFVDYSRTLSIISSFIGQARGKVAKCIQDDKFTYGVVEETCISKFVGTSFAVDAVSVLRKMLGSQALYAESFLGASSFVCNATCAAEGDNTIMELKIVQDMFRGRTSLFPISLLLSSLGFRQGRRVVFEYLKKIGYAMLIREAALKDGQLLKDIAWCRAHLIIMNTVRGLKGGAAPPAGWLDSYESVLIKFPMPVQC